MAQQLPHALAGLLRANDPASQEIAWGRFVNSYSGLLLHVARATAPSYDEAMDRYSFILERLQERRYRRLRSYAVQPQSEFPTWLVVVARRLCLDFHRRRYGRIRCNGRSAKANLAERMARRRLVSATFDSSDALAQIASASDDPAAELERIEEHRVLEAAIARLAPTDRLLLKLRFEDELAARTIAAVLRFPTEFHVYRRLRIVLADLREQLDRQRAQGAPL